MTASKGPCSKPVGASSGQSPSPAVLDLAARKSIQSVPALIKTKRQLANQTSIDP